MLIDLSDYGLLEVKGADAKKLLQGQLTCDVETVTSAHSKLGAHCNPQGRIISLFYLFYFQEAYYLFLPRAMIPITLNALKKYAVFYKVMLTDTSNTLAFTGYAASENSAPALSDSTIIPLPCRTPRCIILNTVIGLPSTTIAPSAAWKRLDIDDGIPAIYPETSGKFLPHEINLHKLNAISFEKGCYTGQEIIARMHYRGKPKSQMYRAEINRETVPLPGSDIYSLQDQGNIRPSGMMVDAYQEKHGHYRTLIVTETANAKNHHLFLADDQQTFFTLQE